MYIQSFSTYLYPDLNSSEFVFVHCDMIKKSIQPSYNGLYKVFERSEKFFTINKNNKIDIISIDKLKPAYIKTSTQRTKDETVLYNTLIIVIILLLEIQNFHLLYIKKDNTETKFGSQVHSI